MMRCPSCGFENPDGVKFCNECATPFPRRCTSCGFGNPPTAKFCGECAAPLGAAPAKPQAHQSTQDSPSLRIVENAGEAPDGERKTVTALFADIKGSMELMEDLDPEEARALVDPALKLMMDAAHRYDGYIVQSTGDGIFALFGAPLAHEDHPQRALYAALRMQEEMRRYSTKLREAGNPPLEARVGVNTGEAVVRSIKTSDAHTEYAPIGHSTSLASRMQTLAPTGSIAVTEATQKFCAGYFNFKALGPTRVKGVTEPVDVFEVTGLGPLRTRLQRAVGRGLTKFVGRQREIDAMKHAAEMAKTGHGQIVAAMAEAGVGKSRLFFEFKAIAQAGWMVLETFSVSHGKASSYQPVIELLCNYFKITDEDDDRSRREKVAGRLAILDPSLDDTRPYIFALLGITELAELHREWEQNLDRLEAYLQQLQKNDSLTQMDPQIQRRRTLEAIKRILLRESLNQPLMVMVEDLHWIDDETQAFLNLLADSIGTARILLLVNYRPEYKHSWNNKTYYTQLRLDPLGRESADEMLASLLGEGSDLAPLKRLLIEKTEGNPLFMEEMFQALLEDGVLVRNGDLKLIKPLHELKIPPTVQAILASRIDRLPANQKELLQTVAVIGQDFHHALVVKLTTHPGEELERLLSALQLAEFIYEQPTPGDIEYTFKHALTHDVAYNSVLGERRKILHERIGAAMEAIFEQSLDDHLSELAHQYGRSGNAHKAIEFLVRSGRQVAQRSAYPEAIVSVTRALEFLHTLPEDERRWRQELKLLTTLIDCWGAMEGVASPHAREFMEQALALARKLGDSAEIFRALTSLRVSLTVAGQMQSAHALAAETLAIAESKNDAAMIAHAHGGMAQVRQYQGEFIDAREHFEKGLAIPGTISPSAETGVFGSFPRAMFSSVFAWDLWSLGYPQQAFANVERAAAFAQTDTDRFLKVAYLVFATRVFICARDRHTAERSRSFLNLVTERGFQSLIYYARLYLGWALAEQGQADEGIAEMERAISEAPPSTPTAGWLDVLRAEAYGKAHRSAEGLDLVNQAIPRSDETGEQVCRAELHRVKGELLLLQDGANTGEAEDEFRTAIEVARKQAAKWWELRGTMSLARLLRDTNRRDEAHALLADIYNWFTEGFDTADLKDAKALLDELGA
jgi:class 3 adenylate cyclase/tetratricopeptide (TPR) repeat protein